MTRTSSVRALILLLAALTASCGGGGGRPAAPSGSASFARAGMVGAARLLPPGPLLVARGSAVGPVAVDAQHLVAVVGPIAAENAVPRLVQRTLPRGPQRTLAVNVDSTQGLASTTDWVVYPTADGTLAAIRHDGSGQQVLSRSLIAPIASRGQLVAWAEARGPRQRVVVRNMRSGTVWVAADLPRCTPAGCYRIDAVTLADRGVVFDRGAIGPQPSLVVRRAFTAPRPSSIEIPGDPQPDLAPSSAGALFYAFERGWYRWDFGRSRPSLTSFGNPASEPAVVRYEHGHWLVLARAGCQAELRARVPGARSVDVESPPRLLAQLRVGGAGTCIDSLGVAWTGSQVVSAWAVQPQRAKDAHVDIGLTGVAVAAAPSPG